MKFIDLAVQQDAIKEELEARLATVLRHGQYIMGPEVEELENILSEYVGVRNCITVSSGTDALLISLLALGVSPGDEIITTPFTFEYKCSIPQKHPPATMASSVVMMVVDSVKSNASELTQYRIFFSVYCSPVNTCPR